MSQENVEIVKRVQVSGVDLVELFKASTPPDPYATGIDVTAFDSGEMEGLSPEESAMHFIEDPETPLAQ